MASEAGQLNPWLLRANTLACAVLAVAIAYVLVRTVYLFLDDAAGSTAPVVYGTASSSSSGQTGAAGRRVDASALAMVHLFGEEGAKPAAQVVPQDVNAPKTRLSLELQGVFVAEDEKKSTAMISEARKESQLYRIGDKVPGNASLAAVYADRVLLNLNGKLEALYFPESRAMGAGFSPGRPGMAGSSSPRSVSARTGRVSGGPRPGFGADPRMPGGVGGMGGMPGVEQADAVVKELQQQIGANPDAMLGQFGLATNNGRGYKITDSSNPAFMAIGGRPGDVILTVNGRSVGDPVADVAELQDVMESGCVKVGVDRNGTQFNAEFCPGQ